MDEPTVEEIRRSMAQTRTELLCRARRLRENASTLTDWRYHVRRHPWAAMGLAAGLGYLLIPKRRPPTPVPPPASQDTAPAASKGLVAGAMAAVSGVLTRMALSYARQKAVEVLNQFAANARAGAAQQPPAASPAQAFQEARQQSQYEPGPLGPVSDLNIPAP